MMLMVAVLIHVIIACSSLVCTTVLFFRPSKRAFAVTYSLVGGTVLSGTYLILDKQAHLVATCESGLLFIGASLFAIILAQKKFETQRVRNHRIR
jgi:hypothetical protein